MKMRRCLMLAAVAGFAISESAVADNGKGHDNGFESIGPSTKIEPYLLPSIEGVSTTSILTAGDSIDGYRLVGVPDGMGAFFDTGSHGKGPQGHSHHGKGGPRTFDLVVHHELGSTAGVVRAHGSKGAFVSRWTIERGTLKVVAGRDAINGPDSLFTWNGSGYVAGTTAFERFCSADLADPDAFDFRQYGTNARIFLGGEETSPPFTSDQGRAMAHVVTGPNTGKSYELPRIGKHSYENILASPFAQKKTILIVGDDSGVDTNIPLANVCKTAGQSGCTTPSEVFVYVGTKQRTGNEIERAGLTNGKLYGLRVKVKGQVVTGENAEFVFAAAAPAVTKARFEFVDFGDVSNKTGVALQEEAVTAQVMQFMRVEDGAWDPRPGKERDFYFVTTGRVSAAAATWRPSRLWHVRFDDIENPEKGGIIELVLTNQFYPNAGTTPNDDPSYQMFDNIGIDRLGRIVLVEDVGNNARLGRVYVYGIDSRELVEVARHNPKFFTGDATTNPNFVTLDEESSGVIDASAFLGDGWFLATVQAHRASTDAELVEGGQLLALYIDPSIARDERRGGHDNHGRGGHDR
jgi:hypothetical protein